MAITINWPTKVISVFKVDMNQIQVNPVPIYELDLNAFRLTLKDLEDNEQGITYVKTHDHNPPLSVGGVDLARTVEILNGYTVTFEDDQYAVNLISANSNVGDVVNVNQVSVRSANSAGLVTSAAIEFGEYGAAVTVDQGNITGSAVSGSIYPTGTLRRPSDNIPDAVVIAAARGFGQINIIGDLTLGGGDDVSDMTLIGVNTTQTIITIGDSANVLNCEFREATVTGILDGGSQIEHCYLEYLNYVNGVIRHCTIGDSITLGGYAAAEITNSFSGIPGESTPSINCGDSGQSLALRDYNGGIRLYNKNGDDDISLDINSGQIILDSTITNGTIVCRGLAKLTDNSTATANVIDELLNPTNIQKASLSEVFIDQANGDTGTIFPAGTLSNPVDNVADAVVIAVERGFTQISILGNLTLTDEDISNYTLVGENAGQTTLTIGASADITNCEINECTVTGVLDSGVIIRDGIIYNATGMNGLAFRTILQGTITMGDSAATFLSCYGSEEPSLTTIDMNAGGANAQLIDFNGGIQIENLGDSTTSIELYVGAGEVTLDSTVTQGEIHIAGTAKLTNNTTEQDGLIIDIDGLATPVDLQYDGSVYIDTINGTSGAFYPKGTRAAPVDNMADAMTIALLRNIRNIIFTGSIALDRELSGYSFTGIGAINDSTVDLNGQLIDRMTFERCEVTGIENAVVPPEAGRWLDNVRIEFRSCYINNVTDLEGNSHACRTDGDLYVKAGGTFAGTEVVVEGDFCVFYMRGVAGTSISLDVLSGWVQVEDLVTDGYVDLNMKGGELSFYPSCTGGTYYLEGYGNLWDETEPGTLTVIENHLLALETIPHNIWRAMKSEYANDIGSFGADLATKADLRIQDSSFTDQSISATMIYGTETGSNLSINRRDGIYWQITEDETDGLEIEMIFNLPSLNHKPGTFNLYGYYTGIQFYNAYPDHYLDLWVYDYNAVAWEQISEGFMNGNMEDSVDYSQQFEERHVDRTNNNEVKFRIIHNDDLWDWYVGTHNLFIDCVEVSSVSTSKAIWDYVVGDTSAYTMLQQTWSLAGGDRLINNNREYFYSASSSNMPGDTVAVFLLLDSLGDSTETNVYQRTKIYPQASYQYDPDGDSVVIYHSARTHREQGEYIYLPAGEMIFDSDATTSVNAAT